MSPRTVIVSAIATAVAVGAVALAIAAQRKAPPARAGDVAGERALAPATASGGLPVMWRMPPFSFRDQHDRPTSASDLRGKVVIADFVFTTCTTICPLITAKMALLQRRLTSEKLRFVSFSVDPAHDTPEALKKYAAAWRPGESRWILLSTTPVGLESVASAMFVSVKPVENDIAHSNLFFLVDEQGGVRGIYESDRNDAIERLIRDTESLVGAAPDAPSPRARATTGSELYAALGCGACHARNELAPPLEKLLGREVALAGGGKLTADAAYVRESIVAPDQKLVSGYSLRMPSYEKELTPSELDALVSFVENLASAAPSAPNSPEPAAKSAAPLVQSKKPALVPEAAKPAKPAETPEVAVDPVCSMSVRVVETTPRATHAGRTVYFCSEMCRERFVAEPARYVK